MDNRIIKRHRLANRRPIITKRRRKNRQGRIPTTKQILITKTTRATTQGRAAAKTKSQQQIRRPIQATVMRTRPLKATPANSQITVRIQNQWKRAPAAMTKATPEQMVKTIRRQRKRQESNRISNSNSSKMIRVLTLKQTTTHRRMKTRIQVQILVKITTQSQNRSSRLSLRQSRPPWTNWYNCSKLRQILAFWVTRIQMRFSIYGAIHKTAVGR